MCVDCAGEHFGNNLQTLPGVVHWVRELTHGYRHWPVVTAGQPFLNADAVVPDRFDNDSLGNHGDNNALFQLNQREG